MSILSAIGNTPLVEFTNFNKNSKVKIYGKLEGNNPGGSIKDRTALYLISKAEESGELSKDRVILEPTSGNTGIALAMIGAAKGYKVRLFMPECVSVERQHILEAYGAEVILTPAKESTDGAIIRAKEELNKRPDKYFMPDQFKNNNNVLAHYETTGPEVFSQTNGQIDYLVAGMGTTGTLMGVSTYLKEKKPGIKVIGIEPTEGHTIQGLKNMNESMVPEIFNPAKLDEKIVMEDGEAYEITRKLVLEEGILVGMSSGAAFAGALNVARDLNSGIVVVILPDRGDRYLSTTLFRSICGKCPP